MPRPVFHTVLVLLLMVSAACDRGARGVLAAAPLLLSFEDEGVTIEQMIGVGDVHGDGVHDLVVVMQYRDSSAATEDTAGFGVFAGDDGRPDDALSSYVQGPTEWLIGAGLGDTDGDGRADMAATSRGDCCNPAQVWLYTGTDDGLSDDPQALDLGESEVLGTLSGDGDLDGDGVRDLVASVNVDDVLGAAVFLGGKGEPLFVTGTANGGGEVYGLGDINGDGYDDVTVGYAVELAYEVFAGDAAGPGTAPLQTLTWEGDDGIFGISTVGDLDGDGADEIAVSRPGDDASPALLYAGSPEGVVLDPLIVLHSPHEPESFGYTMTAVAREDGAATLVLCDPFIDWYQGAAYLFAPGAGGFVDTPAAILAGTSEAWQYARIAADAGDFNHDGVRDLALGGANSDQPGGMNKVYFLGDDLGG